ncbi:hypothetical protein [Deinococcus sp. S9]|uniref:hypothetical protein n=1 Tax=Deinococcus sp. S9 TaxID=2545754 RepID=UPI0014047AE0|nr:hypothetical protein [Deinococcus sp. S9]
MSKTRKRAEETPEEAAEEKTEVAEQVAAAPEEVQEEAPAPEAEAVPDHVEAVPDHLAHRVPLAEYARLRGLNPFQQAHLTRAVGTYDRPFDEWEAARQAVIGG